MDLAAARGDEDPMKIRCRVRSGFYPVIIGIYCDYNDYHIGRKSPILFASAVDTVDVFAIHSIKTQTLRRGPPCDFFCFWPRKKI